MHILQYLLTLKVYKLEMTIDSHNGKNRGILVCSVTLPLVVYKHCVRKLGLVKPQTLDLIYYFQFCRLTLPTNWN